MRKKIGIFGGSFDPPHKGHRWVVETCIQEMNLDGIYVIPSYQTPGKDLSQIKPEERLEIITESFEDIHQATVLDLEIKRQDTSYTIDTLNQLSLDKEEIYLILGEELLFQFHSWKNFEQILHKVNLIIFSHTDFKKKKNWPVIFQKYLKKLDKNKGELNTGKTLNLIESIKFQNISSTQVRNKLKLDLPVSEMLHPTTTPLIQKYYKYLKDTSSPDQTFNDITTLLAEKGALNPQLFQFKETIYESILVTSGLNTRHVRSLCLSVQNYIHKMYGISPQYVEGENLSQWIVLDYNFLIIHIFYDYLRQYYQLEDLWKKRAIQQ